MTSFSPNEKSGLEKERERELEGRGRKTSPCIIIIPLIIIACLVAVYTSCLIVISIIYQELRSSLQWLNDKLLPRAIELVSEVVSSRALPLPPPNYIYYYTYWEMTHREGEGSTSGTWISYLNFKPDNDQWGYWQTIGYRSSAPHWLGGPQNTILSMVYVTKNSLIMRCQIGWWVKTAH